MFKLQEIYLISKLKSVQNKLFLFLDRVLDAVAR